jgi:outer membrane lipoprotein carrier protein
MKIAIRILSLLIIHLICDSTLAQDAGFNPIEESGIPVFKTKIEKAAASLTSLQCSFTQKKIISVLSESVISKGQLLYKDGNKLCWQYSSPYYYLFAINGEKVYIKNEKTLSQFDTKSNTLFKEISLLLINSISGSALIDPKKFDFSFYENATLLKVRLTPKNKTLKSLMNTIALYFEKTTYLVQKIEMIEPSGDTTTIVFSDVKLNQPISDENFVLR